MSTARKAGRNRKESYMNLYWSERGEVVCAKHAPHRGSDTWVSEHWSEITWTQRLQLAAAGVMDLRCENGHDCGERG